MASESGVRVAVEVIPNSLSTPERLVHLIEEQLDGLDVGICFDYGHANLMGDLAEAIETVSGHLWTTHVHDNRGREDEHLVPFMGTINWETAMMETQKIGYDVQWAGAWGYADPAVGRLAGQELMEGVLAVASFTIDSSPAANASAMMVTVNQRPLLSRAAIESRLVSPTERPTSELPL